jgi:Protein of unknown function (DUF3015)
MNRTKWRLIFVGVLLSASGCITNATIELTLAPFDATTDIANGVTAASSEFTQPLREFTSSTTPGAADINSPARTRKKLEMFASLSYENLRADISRGNGEYLVSLATLAGVPSARAAEFQFYMQHSYATMFDETVPTKVSTARIVETAWAEGHGRK